MLKVVVASTNPVKINAANKAFKKMFPVKKFEVLGVSAPSEVSDQPMSESETIKGAINRVRNLSKIEPKADYWVGIEGGCKIVEDDIEAFAWVIIRSKKGKVGKGRTGSFFLPYKIVELIKQGKELGEADDIVFGRKNSKQSNGSVGILTGDVITRTDYYKHAIILALIPFKKSKLY